MSVSPKLIGIIIVVLVIGVAVGYLIPSLTAPPPEKPVLRVWLMPFIDEPEKVLAPIVEKFEEKYDCVVELTTVSYAEAVSKIQAAIAAGEAPDVVYQTQGRFIPIAEFGEAALVVDDLVEEFRDQFLYPDILLESVKWKGHFYGVPFNFWTYLWAVNVDILKEAGYSDEFINSLADYDNPNWNWDTLHEILQRCTMDRDGDGEIDTWGMAYPGGENWLHPFLLWLWLCGGEPFTENYEPNFNTPEVVCALSWLKQVMEEGLMPPGSENLKAGEAIDYFKTGKVAVLWGSGGWPSNLCETFKRDNPDLNYKVIYPPLGKAGRRDTYLGVALWQILKQSKNIELAKNWIRFWLTDPDAQKFQEDYLYFFPVLQNAAKGKLSETYPDIAAMYIKSLEAAHGEPIHPKMAEIKLMYNTITQRVLLGELTPEEAAEEMQREAEEIVSG